ncbi:DUF5329 domain-containing protein [Pseudoxanthomonas sp. NC8]|nr:DUF5329 domain-containing protein [Pseudoxanthomonas sp. NC8]
MARRPACERAASGGFAAAAASARPYRLLVAALAPQAHARPPAAADAEIGALIAQLGQSGCRFQRNGRWHDAAAAQAHLQRKYEWAREHEMAGDAEAFIEQAASRSSFSGRAYRVACPGRPEVDAGAWFRERLHVLRAAAPAR